LREIRPVALIGRAADSKSVGWRFESSQACLTGIFMKDKIKNYLLEVRAELKKVTWPDKKTLRLSTVVIVFLMVIMALYFGIIDLIFSKVISLIIR
jgi:preprotein translocase subunit SecE